MSAPVELCEACRKPYPCGDPSHDNAGTRIGVPDATTADETPAAPHPLPTRPPTRAAGETGARDAPPPTETGRLLNGIDAYMAQFVAFPSEQDRHAVTAWALHTWVADAFDSTPRLAVLAPEKQSGKTRVLEVLELIVPEPKHVVSMSAAVLFRLVGDETTRVTLLMDEADTYLGPKAADRHEDLRGLINAGHRKGATAYRMQMDDGPKVMEFPSYAPVALAGIGDLPDTIMDRSIVIAMRRRAPSERVEQFRRRKVERQVAELADAIEAWANEDTKARLVALLDQVEMPDNVEDRAADVWEALVVIGDLAGEPWSTRIRDAASAVTAQRSKRDTSLGVRLLADVRAVMGDDDRIKSDDLVKRLVALEGAPWSDLKGKPLNVNELARRLAPYGPRPRTHRFLGGTAKGYQRDDFYESWQRYLPPPEPPSGRNPRNNRHDASDRPETPQSVVTPATATRNNAPDPATAGAGVTPSRYGPNGNRRPPVAPVTPVTAVTALQATMGVADPNPPCHTPDCDNPATCSDRDGTERCADHVSWKQQTEVAG